MKSKGKFEKKVVHKLNGEVRYDSVRVISGDYKGEIMSSREAMRIAIDEGLDLILINDKVTPALVRIEDYGKFLYDIKRSDKQKKQLDLKEIKISLNISDNDLGTKSKKTKEFLEKGHKVKITLQLKGRERSMSDGGQLVMLKFSELVNELGIPENMPKYEANKWSMIIKPKK
jgi:translation initiation factor IF-3